MDGGVQVLADRDEWASSQFADADLGDRRRTKRLVRLATQVAGNSSGSIPQQTGGGADMKAAYRLFAEPEVTHAAICQPHFELTRQLASRIPMVFLVQDTMVLNYTSHAACVGLGPIGEGGFVGLHQQNVLAVDPIRRRALGLMYQKHHVRKPHPKGWEADRSARRAVPPEQRESHWWVAAIAAIGSPPQGVRWVHVGDRGEDLFLAYHEARKQHTDWLIRVSHDRRVDTPDGQGHLFSYVQSLPVRLTRTISIRRADGRNEDVDLNVSAGTVTLKPAPMEPHQRGFDPIECWVVRVWERSPAKDAEPLEWILCTSLSCQDDEMLRFVAEGYALRWMIEEFHKCQKTGCQVEMRRLEHVDRLEPLIGLLSVLAAWLLQLKFVARDEPDMPATELFQKPMVQVMARYMKCPSATLSVGHFWRGIGRLGGHPGRKGDGAVGWLRAWRGWQSFQWMMLGAELAADQGPEDCG